MKKYAFILLGENYIPDKHNACFEAEDMDTYIFTVRSFQEAREKVLKLEKKVLVPLNYAELLENKEPKSW